MYDYISNYQQDTVRRYEALYEKFKGIYHALLFAQDEGVFEVTVRSQAGTVVVPVSLNDGTEIAAMMVENFAKRVSRVEDLLNGQIQEVGEEIRHQEEKAKQQEAAFEVERSRVRATQAYNQSEQGQLAIAMELTAKHNASLAQQAAASATPAQKGRPRKAKPQPELMEEVAGIAAGVPMNSGTALAVGRATNLPQG